MTEPGSEMDSFEDSVDKIQEEIEKLKRRIRNRREEREAPRVKPGDWVVDESGFSFRMRGSYIDEHGYKWIVGVNRVGHLEREQAHRARTWKQVQEDMQFVKEPPDMHPGVKKLISDNDTSGFPEPPNLDPGLDHASAPTQDGGPRNHEKGDWVFSDDIELCRIREIHPAEGPGGAQEVVAVNLECSILRGEPHQFRSEADLIADISFAWSPPEWEPGK